MSLHSVTTTNALNRFMQDANAMSALQGISTLNYSTGQYAGFNMSIFDNNSDFSTGAFSNSTYGSNSFLGLTAGKTTSVNIPTSMKQLGEGKYGSSIIDNFFTSMQSVALGQDPPLSIFEQRLNSYLPDEYKIGPGKMLGDYSNFFNTDSVASNQNSTTGYNVFSSNVKTGGLSKASDLMSFLA